MLTRPARRYRHGNSDAHRRIDAAPDEVWAALADFGSLSVWADFVDHSSLLTEQTEGIGMTRRIQMGRATVVETSTPYGI